MPTGGVRDLGGVRNLGVGFDCHMPMNEHTSKAYLVYTTSNRVENIYQQMLVHAPVTCHLDYCNSLFFGIPRYQIQRLQRVLNAAVACVVCLVPEDSHVTRQH